MLEEMLITNSESEIEECNVDLERENLGEVSELNHVTTHDLGRSKPVGRHCSWYEIKPRLWIGSQVNIDHKGSITESVAEC